MTRWYQHRFHTVPLIQLMLRTLPGIPRLLQPCVAVGTALVFGTLMKNERRAVAQNVRQITGSRGLALYWKVFRVFYSFSEFMVSYCYVPQASHTDLLSMMAEENDTAAKVLQHLAAGHGLIVWTAHLGNPEFASRLLEMFGRPVNVARVVEDSAAETLLRSRMVNERLRVVDLKAGASATIELLQALRRNEIVAIQGDRVYNPRHSMAVPFFSKPAAFPLGPFLLSQVSGAPLLPAFVVRQSWLRYRVLGGDMILPAATRAEDDQRAALEQAVGFLEKQLAVHYDQWINFFDFWQVQAHDGY